MLKGDTGLLPQEGAKRHEGQWKPEHSLSGHQLETSPDIAARFLISNKECPMLKGDTGLLPQEGAKRHEGQWKPEHSLSGRQLETSPDIAARFLISNKECPMLKGDTGLLPQERREKTRRPVETRTLSFWSSTGDLS